MPKIRRKPAFQLHSATGQARIRIDGRDIYLRAYDSPEAHERYDDLMAEGWPSKTCPASHSRVDDLCLIDRHSRRVAETTILGDDVVNDFAGDVG